MALSDIDRNLLDRCLNNKPRAWEDFVDRYMGLVVHVINHTAQCRSLRLSTSDREDLAAEVFWRSSTTIWPCCGTFAAKARWRPI